MAYKYRNVVNLQGPDKVIRAALRFIQHQEHRPGSVDFNRVTPMPPWVMAGGDTLRESWRKENWGTPENAGGLTESAATYDGGETVEFNTQGGDVRELMRKFCMMFPRSGLSVDCLWASEDVGKDSGMVQFKTESRPTSTSPNPAAPRYMKRPLTSLPPAPQIMALCLTMASEPTATMEIC